MFPLLHIQITYEKSVFPAVIFHKETGVELDQSQVSFPQKALEFVVH